MIVEENRGTAEGVHGASVVVVFLFFAVGRRYDMCDEMISIAMFQAEEDGIGGRRRGVHGADSDSDRWCRWCRCCVDVVAES